MCPWLKSERNGKKLQYNSFLFSVCWFEYFVACCVFSCSFNYHINESSFSKEWVRNEQKSGTNILKVCTHSVMSQIICTTTIMNTEKKKSGKNMVENYLFTRAAFHVFKLTYSFINSIKVKQAFNQNMRPFCCCFVDDDDGKIIFLS